MKITTIEMNIHEIRAYLKKGYTLSYNKYVSRWHLYWDMLSPNKNIFLDKNSCIEIIDVLILNKEIIAEDVFGNKHYKHNPNHK